jgi:hypothetical protein
MRFILSSLVVFSILSCGKESPVVTDSVISFRLTVTSGGGGSVSSPGRSYTQGKSVSITTSPDSEYFFINWSSS